MFNYVALVTVYQFSRHKKTRSKLVLFNSFMNVENQIVVHIMCTRTFGVLFKTMYMYEVLDLPWLLFEAAW